MMRRFLGITLVFVSILSSCNSEEHGFDPSTVTEYPVFPYIEVDASKVKQAYSSSPSSVLFPFFYEHGVRLDYSYDSMEPLYNDTVTIVCYTDEAMVEFSRSVDKGEGILRLYSAMCGFRPDGFFLKNLPPGFEPVDAAPLEISSDFEEYEPIPVQLSDILSFAPDKWRGKDYELFSWNRYPSVLIMDTADYGVQSRFFKRLAFFVEKEGFIGKILSNSFLEGRHGWNAHDYRAVDLAYFFQRTRDSRFSLNREEEILREILLTNGIIQKKGGTYVPGSGAIISISQESSSYLRRKFLIHESFHGLFFVNAEYESRLFDVWNDLSETEKKLWKQFFGWMGYNSSDSYLMVNEFQAYLLQQPIEEAEAYFRNHPAADYLVTRASEREEYQALLDTETDYFTRKAETVYAIVSETAGFPADEITGMNGPVRSGP